MNAYDAAMHGGDFPKKPRSELEVLLRELVALKDLKEEITRRRGRRLYSIKRDSQELAEVAKMEEEYNARRKKAWAEARKALHPSEFTKATR